ncbi:MAG: AAA family ATPase [Actinomycetota bacterium]|nr:AAA family ATPase [Actinomycetota bacterium]
MGEQLRVRTFGGLELSEGQFRIDAPAKAKALVAYMALAPPNATRSRLAGLLWSDLSEEAARANLRLVLTQLRKALPGRVAADRHAVGLNGDVWIDADELEQAQAGPAAVLELYRGEFLEGVQLPGAPLLDEWITDRRYRYRAMALAALDTVVGKALTSGDTDTAMAAARRILAVEPWHEGAHRALMRCFAVAGQPSAALAQYETCRHILDQELGVEPDPATRDLLGEIRTQEFAPPIRRGELQVTSGALVGREHELGHLAALLSDPACRLVTIVGPGGVGKTRLAMEVGRQAQARGDEVHSVSLAGMRPAHDEDAAALLVSTIGDALGLASAARGDPTEALVEQLRHRRLLLVLDNFERLSPAIGVVGAIAATAAQVRVVVTSRRRLGLGAEWVVELDGLASPPPGSEAEACSYPAVQLFGERARQAGGAPKDDLAAIAHICRLVGGMPLALELAARWTRAVPPAVIAEQLAQGLDLLETAAADVEPRHRSMRTVLDRSWELVDPSAARVLCCCSLFSASFDVTAAKAVAGADLAHLAALVDDSMLRMRADGRYELHELVRQYAADRLDSDAQAAIETARRHAQYFDHLAGTVGPDQLHPDDVENFRTATAWMLEHASLEELERHLETTMAIYRQRGHWAEARTTFVAALARPELPRLLRARWSQAAAESFRQLGQPDAAERYAGEAMAALGRPLPHTNAGWLWLAVRQLLRLLLYRMRPRLKTSPRPDRREAAELAVQARMLLTEHFYIAGRTLALLAVGSGIWPDAARAANRGFMAVGDVCIGIGLSIFGLRRLAGRFVEKGGNGVPPGFDPASAGFAYVVAEVYWFGTAEWDRLHQTADQANRAGGEGGQQRAQDESQLLRAVAVLYQGHYEPALALLQTVYDSARRRDNLETRWWAVVMLVELAVRTGNLEAVTPWLEEAERLAERIPHPVEHIRLGVLRSKVAIHDGAVEEALVAADAALGLTRGRVVKVPWAVEGYSGLVETYLDLLESGVADRGTLLTKARRSNRLLLRFAVAFPLARPRRLLVRGRLARAMGRPRLALRCWRRAARRADVLHMPWEAAEARRLLTSAQRGEAETEASEVTSTGGREHLARDIPET